MIYRSLIIALLISTFSFSQSFEGQGDMKFQVGANIQDGSTGLNLSFDYGVGENISLGVVSVYALGVDEDFNADFGDRFDIRGRFNANLGSVLNVDENFDFYPGLSLGLKNFGGHVGARYFFSEGFGIFTELAFPLAKYNTDDLTPAEEIHNQFQVVIGASFNL